MFNLKDIDFIKTDEQHGRRHYSFVGIRRKPGSERLEFWLPLGFDEFDHENYEKVKTFFFRMYRTFKIYLSRRLNNLSENEKTKDRDGVHESPEGFSFTIQDQVQPIFYGKLNAIDKILEGYDELRISSLIKKEVHNSEIDYSKIHKHLHQAVYLDNDIIYLDYMTIAKNLILPESPQIIQLFCFIYSEIKKELGEIDTIPSKAIELAEIFRDFYLQPNSSLFDELTFGDTLTLLRDILDATDKFTTYKDEDFWHFFEAVEAFLYGEKGNNDEGILWGISNFYDIWEDMCQTFMLSDPARKKQILFADEKGKLFNYKEITPNPFRLTLNDFGKRYLRPDLVYRPYLKAEDILTVKMIKKNGENVFQINFYDFPNIRKRFPDIFKKYMFHSTEEKNWKNGQSFRYLTKNDGNIFMKFVENFLNDEEIPQDNNILIVDYKYMKEMDFNFYNPFAIDERGVNKIKDDIHKQLIYEWTLQKNLTISKTNSEFWIPYYSENIKSDSFKKKIQINNHNFNLSKINVFKINFNALQQYYIQLFTL